MDKKIVCKECGEEFVFTEADQKFYQKKNFTEPKRCPDCRKERRNRENENPRSNHKFERKSRNSNKAKHQSDSFDRGF